jgi:CMP-N-acetylneuraminic acid synthetase
MKTLGLIPARGGSKGIPRKNVRLIAGKPLIAWTIEAALGANALAAVVVSTDDPEIADVARAAGAEVPFLRPSELAQDETPGIDPVLHALKALPGYDAVMLLQPTSPLRTSHDIEGLLVKVAKTGAPAAVSISPAKEHPEWMFKMLDGGRLEPVLTQTQFARRQDLPQAYALNGAMYFAHAGWLGQRRSFIAPETIGYPMPTDRSVDIDDPLDWQLAELLLGSNQSGRRGADDGERG